MIRDHFYENEVRLSYILMNFVFSHFCHDYLNHICYILPVNYTKTSKHRRSMSYNLIQVHYYYFGSFTPPPPSRYLRICRLNKNFQFLFLIHLNWMKKTWINLFLFQNNNWILSINDLFCIYILYNFN